MKLRLVKISYLAQPTAWVVQKMVDDEWRHVAAFGTEEAARGEMRYLESFLVVSEEVVVEI